MTNLVARILASAAQKMWQDEGNLGQYTNETAEHELNLAFHYAAELYGWFPWLNCDFDVTKVNFDRRRPDIILHRRQSHRLNFLVIEVKRGGQLAEANADLQKIRQHWFGGDLNYRFGASVILDHRNHTFAIRLLERANPNPVLNIASGNQFQALNLPRFRQIRRGTIMNLAASVANGQAQAGDLDAAIFRLYGIN